MVLKEPELLLLSPAELISRVLDMKVVAGCLGATGSLVDSCSYTAWR